MFAGKILSSSAKNVCKLVHYFMNQKKKDYYTKQYMEQIDSETFLKSIGDNMKHYRRIRRPFITEEDMADIIGCARQHISNLESGKVTANIKELTAYSCVLGISIYDLVGRIRFAHDNGFEDEEPVDPLDYYFPENLDEHSIED